MKKKLNIALMGSGFMGKAHSYAWTVSYTHLRAHETGRNLVCRLLLEKKNKKWPCRKTEWPGMGKDEAYAPCESTR